MLVCLNKQLYVGITFCENFSLLNSHSYLLVWYFIFNAILRKDPEAARAAMRTHLSNSRERLRRAQELIEAQQA